jgi:predicted N-formylglutamate amidohydrolase
MEAHAADCASRANGGLLITCGHGGNRIPEPYRALFHSRQALLSTHRRFDPGVAGWSPPASLPPSPQRHLDQVSHVR